MYLPGFPLLNMQKNENSRRRINTFYSIINTICTNTSEAGWHEVLNFSQLFLLAWRLPTVANIDGNCGLSVIYFPAHWQYVQISQFQNTTIDIKPICACSRSCTSYLPCRRPLIQIRVAGAVSFTGKPKPPQWLQLSTLRHPKSFPVKPGDIVSPACPGSSQGPPPGWACLKHRHAWNTGMPSQGWVQERFEPNARATSTGSSQCSGAVASHRWPNFLTHSKGRARPPFDPKLLRVWR